MYTHGMIRGVEKPIISNAAQLNSGYDRKLALRHIASNRKKSSNWYKGTLETISTTATIVRFRSGCVHKLVTVHLKRCDCIAQIGTIEISPEG